MSWTGIKGRADFRQCLPTYLTEWQWLSGLLFSPYSHFPVCWCILTPRHCFWRWAWNCPTQHGANVTAWPGYSADVFLMKFCHSIELLHSTDEFYIIQSLWLIWKHSKMFVLMINALMKPPGVVPEQNIHPLHSKCVDLNITAWFTEFPGERESVTCWREPQSDKWRPPTPTPPFLPLVLSHVRLFKHVAEMAWGVKTSTNPNFCTTINTETQPQGQ